MTKREVIELLSKFDDNDEVLIPWEEDDGQMVHKPFTDIVEDANGNALII